MKDLCLIAAETGMEQMTKAERAKHFEEYWEFTDRIRRSGHLVECHRLEPPASAVPLRVRSGQVSTTDGPLKETKEQFGGYDVISAKDMNEAIQVASRIPGARWGCVEVRPIAEDEPTVRALGQ